MKKLFLIALHLLCLQLFAQTTSLKKQSTIDFHFFYNDFATAQKIRTTSLSNVINNKLWSSLSNMQVGLGLSYLKGITNKIDAVATIDGSYVDYLYQSGLTNGSSKFLLTTQIAANVKLLTDNKTIVPYLTGGAGFNMYNKKTGFYIPVGFGLQFNIFNEAFVFTNAQYRLALSSAFNYHFNYSVGIATPINKPKIKKQIVKVPEPIKEKEPVIVVSKQTTKILKIKVVDEATNLPLPNVNTIVEITNAAGDKMNALTDANGIVTFLNKAPANYEIHGMLNNIATSTKKVDKTNFEIEGNEIFITLTHNDPRFTLEGNVINKATNNSEGNVDVTVSNETQGNINTVQSNVGDGNFNAQLEANTDFTIIGKKANYLSNIEKVTTKGLTRSTTLYLKLKLDVQEVTSSKNIVLNNINFETGIANLNTSTSTDLDKLIQFLKDNPNLKLEIQGHTDNVGSANSNKKLSQNRASNIVAYLVKNGIEKNRLTAKGYGSSMPIADNNTENGKAKNRRVEMKLVE